MTDVVKKTNWVAVFSAYCQGTPIEELAQIFDLEIKTVQARIYEQGWANLRATLPLGETSRDDRQMTSVAQIKMLAIQHNRDQNLKLWAALRDDAVDIIGKLVKKELTLERQWHSKGMITRADVDPTLNDRVALATYVRTIADGTYRALGDFQAQEKPGQDAIGGQATAGVPSITIILPQVIAQPREQRAGGGGGTPQVIDLRELDDRMKSANPRAVADQSQTQ